MDGGLEACSAGNVLDFNSLKSSFQQYIGLFHSLQVRPCKSADYGDYLCIYYEKSDHFHKIVETGVDPQLVPLSSRAAPYRPLYRVPQGCNLEL